MSTMTKTSESPWLVVSLTCMALYVIALISVPLACRALSNVSPLLRDAYIRALISWCMQALLRSVIYYLTQRMNVHGERSGVVIDMLKVERSPMVDRLKAYPLALIDHSSLSSVLTVSSFMTKNSVLKM